MKKVFVISLLLATLVVLPASAKTLSNKDDAGLALQGYDPVAFFTDGKPVPGQSSITATHEGATYRFATPAHKAAFEAEPANYAPAFGGYCAYGVAYGGLFPVQIETWQILDGRLILNKNAEIKAEFDKDRAGFLRKANANWPGLLEKKGN